MLLGHEAERDSVHSGCRADGRSRDAASITLGGDDPHMHRPGGAGAIRAVKDRRNMAGADFYRSDLDLVDTPFYPNVLHYL